MTTSRTKEQAPYWAHVQGIRIFEIMPDRNLVRTFQACWHGRHYLVNELESEERFRTGGRQITQALVSDHGACNDLDCADAEWQPLKKLHHLTVIHLQFERRKGEQNQELAERGNFKNATLTMILIIVFIMMAWIVLTGKH